MANAKARGQALLAAPISFQPQPRQFPLRVCILSVTSGFCSAVILFIAWILNLVICSGFFQSHATAASVETATISFSTHFGVSTFDFIDTHLLLHFGRWWTSHFYSTFNFDLSVGFHRCQLRHSRRLASALQLCSSLPSLGLRWIPQAFHHALLAPTFGTDVNWGGVPLMLVQSMLQSM